METATALAEKDRVLDATQTQLTLKENEATRLEAELQSITSSIEDLESKLAVETAKHRSDREPKDGVDKDIAQVQSK